MRFADLEARGLVRLHAEPDGELYDDSFIDDFEHLSDEGKKREKKQLWAQIEREGVWYYAGQYREKGRTPVGYETSARVRNSEKGWETADGIGGIIGTDLSDYRYDLMQSAIDALDAHWAEEAAELSERATYAAGGECVKWKTVREQFTSSDKAYEYVETFTVPTRFRILRVTTECVMESTIEPE